MSLKRPGENEEFATGMVRPKTTALFFDKLWAHPALIEYRSVKDLSPYAVPGELISDYVLMSRTGQLSNIVYENSNISQAININYGPPPPLSQAEEAILRYMIRNSNLSNHERTIIEAMVEGREHMNMQDTSELFWTNQSADIQEFQYRDDHGFQPVKYKTTPTGFRTTVHRNRALRTIVKLYEQQGVELTPVYHDPTEYDALQPDFQQTQEGIEVSLDFVPVAVEDNLSWEQVLDFRRDSEARKKLKRMRRWFTLELQDKSEAEIRATLEEKLDDYSWALRKHGIQTTVGGFTSFLAAAAAPTTLSLLAASPLVVTGGGIALAAGAVAWLANKQVERTELHRSEIAYLHEVRKLVA
jgi:hypothetical protein